MSTACKYADILSIILVLFNGSFKVSARVQDCLRTDRSCAGVLNGNLTNRIFSESLIVKDYGLFL